MGGARTHVTISKNNFGKVASQFSTAHQKKLLMAVGMRVQKAFVVRIHNGDPSWEPLSEAWAEKKGHGRQWYYTGRIEEAIEFIVEGNKVRIGIIKHETYPDTGSSVAAVAAALEFGSPSQGIPERPLFRPVFNEQIDDIKKDAIQDIKKRIKAGKI